MPTKAAHKERMKKTKHKRSQRRAMLRSGQSICKQCGHIGRPVGEKRGGWLMYFFKFPIGIGIICFMIVLSLGEGLLRMLTFSRPKSILWQRGWNECLPNAPHTLRGCSSCGSKNSMKKLKLLDGELIFDRFYSDRFLKK